MGIRTRNTFRVNKNLTFRGFIKSGRQVQQGALTTTTGSDQRNDFPILHFQGNPLNRGDGFQVSIVRIAEPFGDVPEFEPDIAHGHSPSRFITD